jgi:hypothetical protein
MQTPSDNYAARDHYFWMHKGELLKNCSCKDKTQACRPGAGSRLEDGTAPGHQHATKEDAERLDVNKAQFFYKSVAD